MVKWGIDEVVCDCQRRGVKWMDLDLMKRDEYWLLCMECGEGGVVWRRRGGWNWMLDLIRMHWWMLVERNGVVRMRITRECAACDFNVSMKVFDYEWWYQEGNETVGEAFVFWCCFCFSGIAHGWMELCGWGLKRFGDEGVFASETGDEERMKRYFCDWDWMMESLEWYRTCSCFPSTWIVNALRISCDAREE